MAKGKIVVLSHYLFDEKMRECGLNNQNVDNLKDTAFISIIGTKECLEYYLDEGETKHFFMNNHENVLNLDFDDISTDVDFPHLLMPVIIFGKPLFFTDINFDKY